MNKVNQTILTIHGTTGRMEWNGTTGRMEQNGMGWNHNQDGIEWNGMEPQPGWNRREWDGTTTRMEWNGITTRMEWNGITTRMEWGGTLDRASVDTYLGSGQEPLSLSSLTNFLSTSSHLWRRAFSASWVSKKKKSIVGSPRECIVSHSYGEEKATCKLREWATSGGPFLPRHRDSLT